jgi:hypothetical protein
VVGLRGQSPLLLSTIVITICPLCEKIILGGGVVADVPVNLLQVAQADRLFFIITLLLYLLFL